MSKKLINKQIKLALILAVPIIILLVTKWHIIENLLPKISDKDNLIVLCDKKSNLSRFKLSEKESYL